jgi:hypothetical protein
MKLCELFDIEYGQHEYHSKGFLDNKLGAVPLISSKGTDNGIYGYFDIEPKYERVISVPSTGSIGQASVHTYPCCIDDNCLVMKPKLTMTEQELLWYSLLVRKNAYRYV